MREGPFCPTTPTSSASSRTTNARTPDSPTAAHDVSLATGKPILTATELAVAFPDNPGPATVRETGRLCYPSADRAVGALAHLVRRSSHLGRRAGAPERG